MVSVHITNFVNVNYKKGFAEKMNRILKMQVSRNEGKNILLVGPVLTHLYYSYPTYQI